jgi:cytochrome c
MIRRALLAGCALAITLAACSDGAPEAEDAVAAPVSAVAEDEAVAEGVASADDAVAEEAPAEMAQAAAKPLDAEPAPKPAAPATAAMVAAAAAPVAEVIKVADSHPAAYARCVACHTANKGGEDKLGPNLYGVFRTPAAQGSYAYSAALKESGLTWDEATLHKWLENPRALVPGNRMSFPGIKDAAKRQEIIDYLKQQS